MNFSQRKFIFHIEDDEDDRSMLKEAVGKLDPTIEVWSASNGQESLEVLLQFSLLKTLPALIVLDLYLPGMDGKRVLMELQQQPALSGVPLVIFTTSASALDQLFAQKHNVKMFTKPSNEAEFYGAVKDLLETVLKLNNY